MRDGSVSRPVRGARPADFGAGTLDGHTREVLGWQLSRSGKATTTTVALEQALITRFGTLGRVPTPFLLRSDKGLVFTSRRFTRMARFKTQRHAARVLSDWIQFYSTRRRHQALSPLMCTLGAL